MLSSGLMKTLTIRGLDRTLYELLQKESARAGMSMNRFVVRSLQRILGVKKSAEKYNDLDHLFGSWGKEEARSFEKAVATFEEIDPELWKS